MMTGHWAFIVPAYAVTLAGVLGMMAASFIAMRRAEQRARELRERGRQ